MALDFPNAPTLNQTFTAPNGSIWLWDGVKWTATTSTSPYVGQGNVGRNLLHNPLFNVAQRGAGPWTVTGYTLDRWNHQTNLDTINVSRQPLADANRTSIGDESATWCYSNTFTGNAGAASYNYACQRIEDVRRLAGKTVTVSFWATCGTGLKLGVSVDQSFGTGGSPSAYVSGNGQSVTLSATPTRYSLTFTVPSVAGKTLGTSGGDYTQLDLWFSCGTTFAALSGSIGVQSGNTWLWGVQLEIGSVATPLEKPDPRYDLSNCQRFYQTGGIVWSVSNQISGQPAQTSIMLPVTMRAAPTYAITTNAVTNVTSLSLATYGGATYTTGLTTANGSVSITLQFTASADL